MPDDCTFEGCTAPPKLAVTWTEGDTTSLDNVCWEHAVTLGIIEEVPTFTPEVP